MAWGGNEQPTLSINGNVAVVVMLMASLVMCFLYSREADTGLLHGIQNGFNRVNTPVATTGVAVEDMVNEAIVAAEDARATDATLSELEARIAELEAQIALDEEYVLECQRLQSMLALVNMYDIKGTAGRVIARASEPYSQIITVNVGTADGVEVGNTVIGSSSVIGQVIGVTDHTCQVRLITDQNSGIAVMIQFNRREGIVTGSLEGLLYLENVDSNVVVQVGDVLVTSGLGGSYTRGLIVGQVIKVTESVGDASRLIVVSPVDDVATVTEVFVVKSMGSWGAAA